MRKRVTIGAVLVLGLAMMTATVAAAPIAVIDTTFDFGYVPQNAKISHLFTIKSIGEDTLKIVKVIPGCGCTQMPLEKSELGPGEDTRVEVIFNTGQYKGRVTKHPRILTNEGQAQHTIKFLSTVVQRPDSTYPLIMQPSILDFSGHKPGEAMVVKITNVSDKAIGMKLIDFPDGVLGVTVPETVPAGGSVEAMVRLIDPKSPTGFQKSFTVQLDDVQANRFTVPVKMTVESATGHAAASAGH